MSAAGARRSCHRCNVAKRKCDRALPSCRLCRRKKLECVYPPQRPSFFIPIESENTPFVPTPSENDLLDFEATSNELALTEPLPSGDYSSNTARLLGVADSRDRGAWFLDPDSLIVDHTFMPLPPGFEVSDLKPTVRRFQKWMEDWVKTGRNPFIHHKLYRNSLPPCLQIAFTTYSAYLNRTPDTEETILSIVNDQANILTSLFDVEIDGMSSLVNDIARIHALLSYQFIGLFDGDIRSRHLAEKRAIYMAMFLDAALEKARAFGREQSLSDSSRCVITTTKSVHCDESLWQSWILLESLRRTWLVCLGLKGAYDALKQGWTDCHGDIVFTHREGLWSADSSSEWAKLCAEKDVHFWGRFNGDRSFALPQDEIDELGKAMMELTYGQRRYSQWLNGT